ncbi:dipeptide ABC transporter ATP-binding protein [Hoeflea sp. G2-23]|uniref:Dipeptide ABC transporter ATP-binding protein n=1 Tax=Hoeflea algicola TaxID=2983763 RepID=A0ABT3ZEF8_9HYPH|nr:dipeptide ABC transporter ATP-binding protein [Hoeflea algicola]MCY0150185.1 dipeptide ABC transporter ATP-binding protein [Hoeflea algicola]
MTPESLLQVRDLKKHFRIGTSLFKSRRQVVQAVDGVSFDLVAGETLGLVGESGCGKSTLGRLVVRLIEPTEGSVTFGGQDLLNLKATELHAVRKKCQFIFQDPYGSLDPRMRIWDIVTEPLAIEGKMSRPERRARGQELLERVGLSSSVADSYPHEFSGGQRQRIGVARALALDPRLIVCDEPVSALDVSIQAQIINLMTDLKNELQLSYLFISHNLAVVRHIADRVAVMYLGKIVELAPKSELYNHPQHPYTRALISAIPVPEPDRPAGTIDLQGHVPSPINPPTGCRFHTRCPFAFDRCRTEEPQLIAQSTDHLVACHL